MRMKEERKKNSHKRICFPNFILYFFLWRENFFLHLTINPRHHAQKITFFLLCATSFHSAYFSYYPHFYSLSLLFIHISIKLRSERDEIIRNGCGWEVEYQSRRQKFNHLNWKRKKEKNLQNKKSQNRKSFRFPQIISIKNWEACKNHWKWQSLQFCKRGMEKVFSDVYQSINQCYYLSECLGLKIFETWTVSTVIW